MNNFILYVNPSEIQSYIDRLKNESGKNDFIGFNCSLLQKAGSLEKKNLLFTLKACRELPVFLFPILEYCQLKYHSIEKNKRIAQINDIVFHSDKVWLLIQLNEEQATIQELIEKKTVNVSLSSIVAIDLKDCLFQGRKKKIDFSDPNLKIISYYESYCDWLKIIKEKYSGFLGQNKSELQEKIDSKILIISPDCSYYKKILTDFSQIPFICDNQTSASCTSFYPIAEIYKSFDVARDIQQIHQKYNEIFCIGDNNIRKHLSDLIRFSDRGIIERFILIGTERPETNFPLTEWHWTKEEYNAWNDKQISGEVRLKITGENIWNGESNGVQALNALVSDISDITQLIRKNTPSIRLDRIYYFINEYLRFVLPPNHPYLAEIAYKTNDYLA